MKQIIGWVMVCLLLLPQSKIHSKEKSDRALNSVRMMSYNIRNGKGLDNVFDLERTAKVILDACPDVVAVQEIDSVTGRSKGRDFLHDLAGLTLMHYLYAPAIDFNGGKYGIGMLSKERPLAHHYLSLPGREEKRALLVVEFQKYIYACTHLSLTEEDRMRSLDLIQQEAKKAKKPFFIGGDLNAEPTSDFIQALQRQFLILTDQKSATFPADTPNITIDYIAASLKDTAAFVSVSSRVWDEPVASDHRPIVTDLVFKQPVERIFRTKPYLQNPVDQGMTVMWQTHVPAHCWVEYGTDRNQLSRARTVVDGQVICNGLQHRIRLTGLKPGQTYYYRVCSQEILSYQAYNKKFGETAVSDFYTFTLPDAKTTDFTAIILNDLHKQSETFQLLIKQLKGMPYDFAVFNGDCIDDPADHEEATRFLAELNETVGASQIPVFYIRGNHEIRNAYSIGLRQLFDYVGDKTYGAFSWGDTRIVMLDCGEDKPDSHWVYYGLNDFAELREAQIGFLQRELKSKAFKKAKRRVLIHHIPIFGKAPDYDAYNPCREMWGALLGKAPFDICVNGHMHRFEYVPAGVDENRFPIVIGGGFSEKDATIIILQKRSEQLTLRVLDAKGEILKEVNL